jgi:chemotaxis regulatin CheY-phosphate phosphatase CheZ
MASHKNFKKEINGNNKKVEVAAPRVQKLHQLPKAMQEKWQAYLEGRVPTLSYVLGEI